MCMSVAVFVTMYNSVESINAVILELASIKWDPETEFYFIDNASTDNTLIVAKQSLKDSYSLNATILENPNNLGLGGSQKVAFDYALENKIQIAAIFHSDYQPTAADLKDFLDRISCMDCDALLGARFMKSSIRIDYQRHRLLANLFLNAIYSLRYRRRIFDLGSGLNVYRVEKLPNYKSLPNDLSFNCNLLSMQLRQRKNVCWAPITWRKGLAPSSLKAFKLGVASLIPLVRVSSKFESIRYEPKSKSNE
jgi:dolichol-phosphate mannosyltransferase